jgi:hypothetical protein
MSWAKRVVDQTQRGADRVRGVASGEYSTPSPDHPYELFFLQFHLCRAFRLKSIQGAIHPWEQRRFAFGIHVDVNLIQNLVLLVRLHLLILVLAAEIAVQVATTGEPSAGRRHVRTARLGEPLPGTTKSPLEPAPSIRPIVDHVFPHPLHRIDVHFLPLSVLLFCLVIVVLAFARGR